jgi:hypothetical protein
MNTTFYFSKKIHNLLFFAAIAIIFFSCQKTIGNLDAIEVTTTLPDLVATTTSSASGFVTDENEAPVKNATVQVGTYTTTTDKYGYFEAKNVQVVRTAAVVSITKTGYFKGIKTYIATTNKAAFFRIKLIPKTIVGSFNATAGGVVTLPSGLSINFPASAIVNASTNAAYSGTVNVAAFYINPTAADINRTMPGDLRGLNTVGEIKLLTSYGMSAVELTSAGGELLQIASGKKAGLTMPIPTSLGASAPASIPLWYFNETNGLWKEEGVGTKTGNNYVGEVSHFSFWNCDVPNNFVQFNCTVVNTAGQPVQNASVKISLVSNPLVAAYGYTDSSGYVQGAVPNNAQLKLEVFGNSNCTTAAFSQTFTTTNGNVAYGNVIINSVTSIATLIGNVNNCSGVPVTNGFIILLDGNAYSRYPLSNTGTYNFNKVICSFPNTVSLIGEDITSTQQSLPVSYIITSAGVNNLTPIFTCGITTQQYLNYTVNGTNINYLYPTDSLRLSLAAINPSSPQHWIYADRIPYSPSASTFIRFSGASISQGSSQNLLTFQIPQITDSSTFVSPTFVNISEYGNIGQFVSGNFSGVMSKITTPNITYNVNCNFRIRRTN